MSNIITSEGILPTDLRKCRDNDKTKKLVIEKRKKVLENLGFCSCFIQDLEKSLKHYILKNLFKIKLNDGKKEVLKILGR